MKLLAVTKGQEKPNGCMEGVKISELGHFCSESGKIGIHLDC